MSHNPFDLITPSAEELHELEVMEAIGERDARIARLKSLLEQAEAERDGYRAAAADLRDELNESNSARAYLADDVAEWRTAAKYLASRIAALDEMARAVVKAPSDLAKLVAASVLVNEVQAEALRTCRVLTADEAAHDDETPDVHEREAFRVGGGR